MFRLRIMTPAGVYFDEDVVRINIKSTDGRRTILPNHMPLVLPTDIGSLSIKTSNESHQYFAFEGIFTFENNEADLMVTVIEREDQIDFIRAEKAKERALKRLEQQQESLDLVRAEAALRRAIERLRLRE